MGACLVTFGPLGRTYRVREGGTLMRAAVRARVPIASSCGGEGVCGACRVRVVQGGENLSPAGDRERAVLDAQTPLGGPDERLACLAAVHGPVTVTTSYW
jgi:ferredoxin